MFSNVFARRPSAPLRWLAPWSILLVIAGLAVASLSSVFAAGDTAENANTIGTGGQFQGTVGPGPDRSLWYRFRYEGSGTPATVRVEYQPADSNRLELELYTGDPASLRREATDAVRADNTLTATFTDPDDRDVFVRVLNNHQNRSVSFVGTIEPSSVVAAPPAGTTTPTPGPVASNSQNALTVAPDGMFQGTLATGRAVWWRFYYDNTGADATVTANISPDATDTTLDVYTMNGSELTRQSGSPDMTGDTLSRSVNLSTPQWVYFTVVNNKSGNAAIAYSGMVSPVGTPPVTPTATPTVTATATTAPVATATPAPVQPAPAVQRDSRYFIETGYRVDSDVAWDFFQSRGGIETFGFPVSRTFQFLGCPVQIFQRLVIQLCPGQGPALINLLDPEIFPYTRVNQSVFPAPDDEVKNNTPQVGSANYDERIIQYVRDIAPDDFEGDPVAFEATFFATGGLEVWGAPISRPQRDPGNANFVYQRFQRGIMHFTRGQGTRGILLADYLKQILLGPERAGNLPPDLRDQAQGSRYFAQYCPGNQGWLCRPAELGGTDLTFAFERG